MNSRKLEYRPLHGDSYIHQVHEHDVLNGRGVHIAQHPGNLRFRALVQARYDTDYCEKYTPPEKQLLAKEIIAHIQSLNPPGRFLKRLHGKSNSARGLQGPWEELSQREAIKKTCQALRDCNRPDRSGYAAQVAVPQDVVIENRRRSASGLTNKQYIEQVIARSTPPPAATPATAMSSGAFTSTSEHSFSMEATSPQANTVLHHHLDPMDSPSAGTLDFDAKPPAFDLAVDSLDPQYGDDAASLSEAAAAIETAFRDDDDDDDVHFGALTT